MPSVSESAAVLMVYVSVNDVMNWLQKVSFEACSHMIPLNKACVYGLFDVSTAAFCVHA